MALIIGVTIGSVAGVAMAAGIDWYYFHHKKETHPKH